MKNQECINTFEKKYFSANSQQKNMEYAQLCKTLSEKSSEKSTLKNLDCFYMYVTFSNLDWVAGLNAVITQYWAIGLVCSNNSAAIIIELEP